jgi:hemerythrin-like domain-containing protein
VAHRSLEIIRQEHASQATVLRAMQAMVDQGPGDDAPLYFDVMRGMLFYIDEFPQRQHHPKESELLFPRVLKAAPELQSLVDRLEREHQSGEAAVRELQHLLLAWELLGESRKPEFVQACVRYIAFSHEHMRLEETALLPVAQASFSPADWAALDTAFSQNRDPLSGKYPPDPVYDRLFARIVLHAPGASWWGPAL